MKFTILILLSFFVFETGHACSMYKITVDGKTMVGNNEDSWRTDPKIWFEKGTSQKLGVAYVGYAGKLQPDGAMNERGLVFDAFTMPRKLNINGYDANNNNFSYSHLKTIMQQCKNVHEVYAFLENHSLAILNGSPFFNGGMFLFVDKSGDYLVVETDKLTLGNDQKFVLSNFSFADTKDLNTIKQERYRKGVAFLDHKIDTTLAFCSALSDTMSVNRKRVGDGTLYTTIYDLHNGIIYAYFYHDFSRCVTFNLNTEFDKGTPSYLFTDLFPGNTDFQKLIDHKTPQNSMSIKIFLVFAGLGFFIGAIHFLRIFIKTFKNSTESSLGFRIKASAYFLLYLPFSFYALVLIKNQAIFYFPAPYSAGKISITYLTSYLPFVLLLIIIPLIIDNVNGLRFRNNTLFSRVLITLNNFVFLVLIALFAYWGLFIIG